MLQYFLDTSLAAAAAAAAAVTLNFVTLDDDPTRVVVEATGLADPAKAAITLHLLDGNRRGPAMFGKNAAAGKTGAEFRPSVKLSRGATYRARLILPDTPPITADYHIPAINSPSPNLTAIFPTSPSLPANLLKFYLYFDQPMREGRAIFDQVHLEDDSGTRVRAPWRREEIWSDDARRLMLIIHPGRIKRGVNLREEFGPVLQPDRKYTLVIDKTVRSAAGEPLGGEVRHKFTTLAEDYLRPLPEDWILTIPRSGTRNPLRIESPEPLDHALIWKLISVRGPDGKPLSAKIDIDDGERSWFIEPAKPWSPGKHHLIIHGNLEDLAGNTPRRIFDNDLTQPQGAPGAEILPFTPAP